MQPIQIAKDADIRKFRVWKACTGKKAKGVAGQLFAEEVRYVTHGPLYPSRPEPGVDGVIQERSVQEPLVKWYGPCDIHRRRTVLENLVSGEALAARAARSRDRIR